VNFNLYDCAEFHSEFQALEVTRHTPLTDKMSLHYFELPKIPTTFSKDNELLLWLSLFNANTEEDLKRLEALEVPDMKQAIGAYRHVSATDEFKEIERMRSRARHNEASALRNARTEERFTIARNMLKRNRSIDEIVEDTGLTHDDVEALRDAN